MNGTVKEVRFDVWCSTCKNCAVKETDDPCNECLAQGCNEDSTKPILWEQMKTPIKTNSQK